MFENSLINLLFSNPLAFFIVAAVLIVAISIHEFAHAWAADELGDPTPRSQGRVTLDPRAHLDPWGTLLLLFVGFGWGKPVPFDPYNLKDPVRDGALIALAGPASNIILAILAAGLLRLPMLPEFLMIALIQLIFFNLVLAIFNLIPIYPLDGSKLLMALLPRESAREYEQFMNQFGLFVLLFFLIPFGGTSPASQLISPIIQFSASLLLTGTGL